MPGASSPTEQRSPTDLDYTPIASHWLNTPLRCGQCVSLARPEVTGELWNETDRIVVGCATCRTCQRRYLFTRHLTSEEKKFKQRQGQPIRSR